MTIKKVEIAAEKPVVGNIFKSRFGDILITTQKYGRKFIEYKFSQVGEWNKVGWIKLPFGWNFHDKYKMIRKATPAEMKAGISGLMEVQQKKAERVSQNRDAIHTQNIEPGDIVNVRYSNGPKKEVVFEVDYRAGKLAIVREWGADRATKRRMLPTSICTKVASGGGKFDPHNPLYTKMGMYIPDFYKQGGRVAPRPVKRSFW